MPDETKKLYDRLVALKKNLSQEGAIDEKYVREYHDILDGLKDISGDNLAEFYIPENQLQRRPTSSNPLPEDRTYSKARYCDYPFFFMKIDAVLGCFTLPTDMKKEIGFKSDGV